MVACSVLGCAFLKLIPCLIYDLVATASADPEHDTPDCRSELPSVLRIPIGTMLTIATYFSDTLRLNSDEMVLDYISRSQRSRTRVSFF